MKCGMIKEEVIMARKEAQFTLGKLTQEFKFKGRQLVSNIMQCNATNVEVYGQNRI
jgi:hypothetical protein